MERPAQCLLYLGIGDHAAADESGGSEAIFSQVHRRTSGSGGTCRVPGGEASQTVGGTWVLQPRPEYADCGTDGCGGI